ncbi:MAG: alkane 1-monooxygenase [Rubrivivax sp.]
MRARPLRFALVTALPLAVAWGLWHHPHTGWLVMLGVQLAIAAGELLPALRRSAPAEPPCGFHPFVLRLHVPLQAALLALGLFVALRPGHGAGTAVLAGLAVGGVTGALGITIAHELGHSRSRLDRALAWLLMGSVLYVHFMVEHYRGHHVCAATDEDPASARRGESVWRFLPRTLGGGWRSAWALEAAQLARWRRGWARSPLAWAVAGQAAAVAGLFLWLGPLALLFWLAQAAYAVLLLETINYIEHYGLRRAQMQGRPEPFSVGHAWNADHALSNALLVNLQRHSDHHMHAWKPYPTLEALPGPQLPTGYSGCVFLAWASPLWVRLMEPRFTAAPCSPTPRSGS